MAKKKGLGKHDEQEQQNAAPETNIPVREGCDHITDPFLKAECEREVTLRGNETVAQKAERQEAERNGTRLTAEQKAAQNIAHAKKASGAPENKMEQTKPLEEKKENGERG
jgi:hypothetical protein